MKKELTYRSEVGLAVRKLRPEFAHLEQHPFVHDEDHLETRRPGGSLEEMQSLPPPIPVPAAVPPKMSELDRAPGPSRQNKFHFWYIGGFSSSTLLSTISYHPRSASQTQHADHMQTHLVEEPRS